MAPGSLARHLSGHDRVVAESHPTGHGVSSTAMVGGLVDAGHRVTAISHRHGQGRLVLTGPQLTLVQVPSRSSARAQALDGWRTERRLMVRAVHDARPDVVHGHWTYEWGLAALEAGPPTVITARDAPLTVLRRMPDGYRLLRTALAYRVRVEGRSSTLTAVSPYLAAAWRRQMLWQHEVTVIPNMVPDDLPPGREKTDVPVLVEVAN
ncbi:glycosyltransferase, partial [Georgenia sp. 10Sc9-8]|nr:glycosyltransferase [Georgenia halotolerans]